MVQFQILSGKKAGAQVVARRFPFRAGRAASNDLVLEDAGVWDRHMEIAFCSPDGFFLCPCPNAPVRVNDQPVGERLLRNGDLIELGAVRLSFGLTPLGRRSFRLREGVTWGALVVLFLTQVAVICWLAR